ncbi:SDR family oxidoreductase [Emcibacter sp. SYSU 3D8]|uniref:SDR family NAD(P)-dependent oxidoreductase n=1 Tax=Emcibacter sp. SYSU 3D8 TaxID=3133969 RepID=UPI0031FEEA75
MAHGYGKTALVTGASSGIGRELAAIFAEHGYNLVVVARNEAALQALAEELYDAFGTTVTVLPKDLSKASAPQQIFKALQADGIHIDVLINNAGFGAFRGFADTPLSRVTGMIGVNVAALTELCHLFAGPMIEHREGRILNVASVAAFNPTPNAAVYGATKAFVLSLSEALSEELQPYNITVTALCPGLTETGFSREATGKTGANPAVPGFMMLNARQVAKEGFDALHAGDVIRINGLAYQLGVEWLRYTPRAVARTVGAMFGKQLEDGF